MRELTTIQLGVRARRQTSRSEMLSMRKRYGLREPRGVASAYQGLSGQHCMTMKSLIQYRPKILEMALWALTITNKVEMVDGAIRRKAFCTTTPVRRQ